MFWSEGGSSRKVYTINIETGVTKAFAVEIAYQIPALDVYIVNGIMIYNGNYIKVQ
jgi:hypothetical protein